MGLPPFWAKEHDFNRQVHDLFTSAVHDGQPEGLATVTHGYWEPRCHLLNGKRTSRDSHQHTRCTCLCSLPQVRIAKLITIEPGDVRRLATRYFLPDWGLLRSNLKTYLVASLRLGLQRTAGETSTLSFGVSGFSMNISTSCAYVGATKDCVAKPCNSWR